MSDTPSKPKDSRRRRGESRREPATIDLTATELRPEVLSDAPATAEAAADAPVPEDTSPAQEIAAEATPEPADSWAQPSPTPTPDEVIPSDDVRPLHHESDLPPPSPPPEASVPLGRADEPRRKGLGVGALLGAGLIGGIIGAGATILVENWWRPRAAQMDTRLAQVEQRLAAVPPDRFGPLDQRLASVEAATKALTDRLSTTQTLAERTAREVQESATRAPSAQPGGPENAETTAAVRDLVNRLGTLEKQVAERAQTSTAVQERLGALEKHVEERTQASTALQERFAALQESAQSTANTVQTLERRLADQDQRLAALARQFSERGPEAMAAGLRVTLADRLGDALQDGAPLGQILAMLRRLDIKPESLKPLEPYAQEAPPSPAALAQEFRPLGQRLIAEARASSGDWDERLWRMIDKVVTVRAVGDPKSTDVASLVARIEDALARNALAEAVAAWDALPEPARATAQGWGDKLKRRTAAEAAAQRIYMEALSALEASTR